MAYGASAPRGLMPRVQDFGAATQDSGLRTSSGAIQCPNREVRMKNFNLDAILEAMLKMSDRVSDLNFSVGRPPQVEIDGALTPVTFPGLPRLTPYQTEIIAIHMLRGDRELTRTLLQNGSVDLSYSIPMKTRFRVNIFSQRGTYAIVLRVIPEGIPTLQSLNLPAELANACELKNGIILVTGP